jgi:hypothetical protein
MILKLNIFIYSMIFSNDKNIIDEFFQVSISILPKSKF